MTEPGDEALYEVLGRARALGVVGDDDLGAVIAHARRYVAALDGITGEVVDLGSGGGIPGLVIAADRADLRLTLIDRRERRTDLLRLAVRQLGWEGRVEVRTEDLDRSVALLPHRFDAVTARSAGPPLRVLRWAVALLAPGGRAVISDPPNADHTRWPADELERLGVERRSLDGLSVFV